MKRQLPGVVLITAALVGTGFVVAAAPAAAAVVTATPSSVPNTSTAADVTFAVGAHTASYLAGGVSVNMTGPGEQTATYTDGSPSINALNGKITATFDLNSDLPAAPGTYAVVISGSLASDTSVVTVTSAQPTLRGSAELPAGESGVPLTVTAATGTFAAGDVLTFTHGSTVVSGLNFSNAHLETGTFSGDVGATRSVAPGAYNITVTDTSGGKAVCTSCVTVDAGAGVVTGLAANAVTYTSATLTWSAPATGPAATGYSVFVSTDPDPTNNDPDLTVTHTGADTTATVSGLSPGTKYYAAVVATTIAGLGDAAPLTFFASEPSTLTLAHTSLKVTYGQKVTLSGHLAGNAATSTPALLAQAVSLYVTTGTSPATLLKTVLTDSSGDYFYRFTPQHNASYFANFAGATGSAAGPMVDPARSTSAGGTVAQAITLKGAAVHHFKWLQLTGKIGPSAAGRTVVIYNRTHGRLRRYATAKVGSASTYNLVLKHVKSGRYKLIAKISATSLNPAGASKVLPVLKP